MRCVVCMKQVPSTNKVRLDPETNTIIRDGKQSVINPFDMYALEEAVRIKERTSGNVTVVSMGIPAAERLLRDAMSRGADSAVLLSDRAFAGADTLATSYALSLGIRHIGDFDLIFCGKMAVDGDTAQIGPELAETLDIPHVTDVMGIVEYDEKSITVRRSVENGTEVLRVRLPALLCVVKDINMPRMSSISGIKYSLDAPLEILGARDVNADETRIGLNGSPTQVVRTFTPERRTESIQITGTAAEQASSIAEILCGTEIIAGGEAK